MPPRTKKPSIKASSTVARASSSQPQEPQPLPVNETYPWPRLEGRPVDPNDPKIPENSTGFWNKETTRVYNAFLEATISPTRFLHSGDLYTLGLHEDAHAMLSAIGVAELCLKDYPLYPDLVRQCLASCEITYVDSEQPTLDTAYFSFFASGKKYTLSMDDFNGVFEIDNEPHELFFPKKFPPTQKFWELIANGEYKSRSAYQSAIRNPTLRIIAKTLSHILFSKETAAKVSNGELQLLYAGVRDEILSSRTKIPHAEPKTNPGFILAQMLVDKKSRVQPKGGKGIVDRCGSILTPLFQHLSIDLKGYKVVSAIESIDIPYLIHCGILRDNKTYSFYGRDGTNLYCSLPQPNITGLDTWENIEFVPRPEFLCADPRPTTADETMDDVEDVTPLSEYDLGPLADDADENTYRRWMVASQRKNNSLMQKILRAVTGGCFQTPIKTQGATQGEQGEPPLTGHRRGRNRRKLGHSESEDTD